MPVKHLTLDRAQSKSVSASDICSSATAFQMSCNDEELLRSRLPYSIVAPTFEFVAAVGSDVYIYDNSKSVIRSLSDIASDSVYFCVEDNFSRGGELAATVVARYEARTDVRRRRSARKPRCDTSSNTTFLSCFDKLSAKASSLCLFASKMKALVKVVTSGTVAIENQIFAMALYSSRLKRVYRHRSAEPDKPRQCDLLLADICVSCGHGKTKKAAKHCARSNAVELLQKSYLHIKSSLSDSTLRLIGSQKPLVNESYNVVRRLDVANDDLLPVFSVINSSDQLTSHSKMTVLAAHFKRLISVLRTICHVLEIIKPGCNAKLVKMAAHVAGLSVAVRRVVGGQRHCACLWLDVVLVAYAEAATRTRLRDRLYTAAVELLMKSHLCLIGAQLGAPARLIECRDEPVDGRLSVDDASPPEAHFVTETLPRCAGRQVMQPITALCAAAVTERSPDVHSSDAHLPASLHRLSRRVKSLCVRGASAVKGDVAVMLLALNESKLPSHTRVCHLGEGQGYRCDLWVASVLVGRGEATQKTHATRKAYTHAVQLLQQRCLCLAPDDDGSTVLVGSDELFEELHWQSPDCVPAPWQTLDCVPAPWQRPDIGLPLSAAVESVVCRSWEHCAGVARALLAVNSATWKNAADDVCAEDEAGHKQQRGGGNDNSEMSGSVSSGRRCDGTETQSDECWELMEHRATAVASRSDTDPSRVMNQFHSLARTTKAVYAAFGSTKTREDMLEMAVRESGMCSRTQLTRRDAGRVCCRLLIDDVVAATADHCDRKSAKLAAYSAAAERLCMPYLCLDEQRGVVWLVGSYEPFTDTSRLHGHVSANARLSPGSLLDDDGSADLDEPSTLSAHLSDIIDCFHSFVCRVRALSDSAFDPGNDVCRIHRALAGNMHARTSFTETEGVYRCDLSIDGVRVASGEAVGKKRAKHATYSAAVELFNKQYLRVQEINHSYKLIGSDQPFVGVTYGVLPREQNCVVTEKGKFVKVKQSAEPQDSADGQRHHSSAITHNNGKSSCGEKQPRDCVIMSRKSTSDASQNEFSSRQRVESCSQRVQSSAAHNQRVEPCSQRVESSAAHNQRVESCSQHVESCSQRVQSSGAHSQRVESCNQRVESSGAHSQRLESCSQHVESCSQRVKSSAAHSQRVESSGAHNQRVESCSQHVQSSAAHNQRVESCSQRVESSGAHSQHVESCSQRVKSCAAHSQRAESCSQRVESSGAHSQRVESCSQRVQSSAAHSQRVESCSQHVESCSQRVQSSGAHSQHVESCSQRVESSAAHSQRVESSGARSLSEFVILQSDGETAVHTLHNSAAFNKWLLSYGLSKVEGGRCCQVTLGGHSLASVVRKTKKPAKKAASKAALKRLNATCWTLRVKQRDVLANALTRNEVCLTVMLTNRISNLHCLITPLQN